RRGDEHDVNGLAIEQRANVVVSRHSKRVREFVELCAVVPRGGDELGGGIFANRSRQTLRRVPMSESENCHTPFFHPHSLLSPRRSYAFQTPPQHGPRST